MPKKVFSLNWYYFDQRLSERKQNCSLKSGPRPPPLRWLMVDPLILDTSIETACHGSKIFSLFKNCKTKYYIENNSRWNLHWVLNNMLVLCQSILLDYLYWRPIVNSIKASESQENPELWLVSSLRKLLKSLVSATYWVVLKYLFFVVRRPLTFAYTESPCYLIGLYWMINRCYYMMSSGLEYVE